MEYESLEDYYAKVLGGNTPHPGEATPEAIEVRVEDTTSPPETMGSLISGVDLNTGDAQLDGMHTVLEKADISAIRTIVAGRIAVRLSEGLDEFRRRNGLQSDGKERVEVYTPEPPAVPDVRALPRIRPRAKSAPPEV